MNKHREEKLGKFVTISFAVKVARHFIILDFGLASKVEGKKMSVMERRPILPCIDEI